MSYVKNTWVDQDVERPKTYQVTENQDGSITLTDDFGLVTEIGTPVDQAHMNHIEDGIEGVDVKVGELTNLQTTDKTSIVNAINSIQQLEDLRLHALKGYEDAGELLTDAEGLGDVTKYAYSTFDASKFDKTGSPSVTGNGIYTPDASNYFKLPSIDFTNTSEVKIRCAFKYYSVSDYTDVFSAVGGNYAPRLVLNPNGTVSLYLYDGTNQNTNVIPETYFTAGEWYILEWTFNNTVASYKLYSYDNTLIHSDSHTAANILTLNFNTLFGTFRLGIAGDSTVFGSLIDLKQFKIWADGVPVFSGNQTGVDTIKSDNYTPVEPSPHDPVTISSDGVASGFSGTKYVKTASLSISNATDFECFSPYFKLGEISGGVNVVMNFTTNTRLVIFYRQSNSKLESQLWQGSTPLTSMAASTDISLNKWYQFRWVYKNSAWSSYLRELGGDWTTIKSNISDATGVTISGEKPLGWENSTSYMQNGFLDLNGFKIYVNGDLVYQPCLKIPYTLSKTGSKIADKAYRDRVNDMYNQFGSAPYYTLNEGVNFTIPQGEIYGMLGNRKWQFVPSASQTLSTSTTIGTNTIDLSGVLPNDGYNYECLFTYAIVSHHSSNTNSNYNVTIDNIEYLYDQVDSGSSDEKTDGGQFIGIAKYNSVMDVKISNNALYTGTYLKILAYKRADF